MVRGPDPPPAPLQYAVRKSQLTRRRGIYDFGRLIATVAGLNEIQKRSGQKLCFRNAVVVRKSRRRVNHAANYKTSTSNNYALRLATTEQYCTYIQYRLL